MASAELIELNGSKPAARARPRRVGVVRPNAPEHLRRLFGLAVHHWRDDFYPAELPTFRWFAHYALTFDTVEINNSFYRLPPAETFAKLRPQWPINPAARRAGLKTRLHRSSYTRSSYQFGFNNDTGVHALRDARLRQKIAGTIARRANARAPRTYTSDR